VRLAWFRNLKPAIQLLVLSGLIFVLLAFYIPLSKYVKPAIISLLLPPLKLCEGVSSNARQFLKFQDLAEENKRLETKVDKLTGRLLQWQEAHLENQRLRSLLSLPQRKGLRTKAALLIGKDSSNWTMTVLINQGTKSGIREGMPVVLGANLAGKVIEASPFAAKVALIVDFNSKIPAKILRTREEGIVFGARQGGRRVCKIKYIQGAIKIGDRIISSGLGKIYPKGLLIGEVVAVEEEESKLYRVAEIQPAVDFASLEEVTVITSQ